MHYPLEGRRQSSMRSQLRAVEAMAAPAESDAPEAWDFLEVLSSPGCDIEREPVRSDLVSQLDWLARFTRDHFDRNIRGLHAAHAGRDYILQRMRGHAEMRSRLAALCVDANFESPAHAVSRMRELCLQILLDAEAHEERPRTRN